MFVYRSVGYMHTESLARKAKWQTLDNISPAESESMAIQIFPLLWSITHFSTYTFHVVTCKHLNNILEQKVVELGNSRAHFAEHTKDFFWTLSGLYIIIIIIIIVIIISNTPPGGAILQQFVHQVQYTPQHIYTSVYVATSDHNP